MSDTTAVDSGNSAGNIVAGIAPIASLYQTVGQLLPGAFQDVSKEHLHARPNDKTNSMHWIFGHIIDSRYGIARLVGADINHDFGKVFSMGEEIQDSSAYPSLDELLEAFNKVSRVLEERFEAITEDELNAKSEFQLPGQDQTVAGCVTFLSFHEGYHVGQIGMIRKFYGYERIAG